MPIVLIVLCVIVCAGATYAFFTDSVSSGNNKVESGRLIVDLEFLNKDSGEWISIKEDATPVFYHENWEPGYTEVKIMKIVNRGSVALKWEARLFSAIAVSEYADIIQVYVKTGKDDISYPQGGVVKDMYLQDWTSIGTLKDFINSEYAMTNGELQGQEDFSYLAIALHMPTTAGNEYQEKVLGEFDIRILATQLNHETDEFGPDYDKDATFPCSHAETEYEAIAATSTTAGKQWVVCKNCKEKLSAETPVYFMFSGGANLGYYNVTGMSESYPSTDVVIPDTYRGLPVKNIGEKVFLDNERITSVIIPNGIINIGRSAFNGCTSLTSVTIPESVESMSIYAFSVSSHLQVYITNVESWLKIASVSQLPNNYGSLHILDANGNEITELTIPNTVTSIGKDAFKNAIHLTSVTIPDSVTVIGDSAFQNCNSLVSISLSDTLTSISAYAFQGCSSLSDIVVSEGVTAIGNNAFQGCTALNRVQLPQGVISIGNYLFQGCASLENITIPQGVTSIGNYAFQNCTSLANITFAKEITSIGSYAFQNCTALTEITLPESLTTIGKCAFRNTGLASVSLPDNLAVIGSEAFIWCNSLKEITISKNVESIESNAFLGCPLQRVIFEATDGWYTSHQSETSENMISTEDLADPATAATYLKTTYVGHLWTHNAQET